MAYLMILEGGLILLTGNKRVRTNIWYHNLIVRLAIFLMFIVSSFLFILIITVSVYFAILGDWYIVKGCVLTALPIVAIIYKIL